MSSGTNFKLNFEGLVPSTAYTGYLANYNGYGGFNFEDMGLFTKAGIEEYGYENTSYGSVLHGQAEAFILQDPSPPYNFGYGRISSVSSGETFSLKSGIFASAWDISQPTYFETFKANGTQKADVKFMLGQSATTIDFANYGNDFKHIGSVAITSRPGIEGKYGYGFQIAMDNLKVHWFGPIPGSGASANHPHVNHPVLLAALAAQDRHGSTGSGSAAKSGTDGAHDPVYRSELTTLTPSSHHGGGLTSEFSLPQSDHFGT